MLSATLGASGTNDGSVEMLRRRRLTWTSSFSTRQKRQWIEFAQRLQAFLTDDDGDLSEVEDILAGVPVYEEEDA